MPYYSRTSITLAGIDLAWKGEKNPSAIAIGKLNNRALWLESIEQAITGFDAILNHLKCIEDLKGVAIDASLIIPNKTGQRQCERELAKVYSKKRAACHATNLTLYPNPFSVKLSNALSDKNFHHLGTDKWQIECYPHPSLIEIFGFSERLQYKKGSVNERKAGQIQFSQHLKSLSSSPVVSLHIPDSLSHYLSQEHINSLRGQALKSNEDALDAIICLYIGALYSTRNPAIRFGSLQEGYIWVPQVSCLPAAL